MWKILIISCFVAVSTLLAGPRTARGYLQTVGPSTLRFEQDAPPMVVMNLPPLDMGRDDLKAGTTATASKTNALLAANIGVDAFGNPFIGPPLPPDWTNEVVSASVDQTNLQEKASRPPIIDILRIFSGTNGAIISTTPVIIAPSAPATKSSSAVYFSPPVPNTQP